MSEQSEGNMVSLGSGRRARWGTQQTVEDYCRLDVRSLQRMGYLTPGASAFLTLQNRRGKGIGSIRITTTEEDVQLRYRSHRIGQDIEETVPLVWTSCHYGGNRPWFLCPGGVNDPACWRRVAILYDAGTYFL